MKTDTESAIERLTDWINQHADHKQRAFIEDVTLVLAAARESAAKEQFKVPRIKEELPELDRAKTVLCARVVLWDERMSDLARD